MNKFSKIQCVCLCVGLKTLSTILIGRPDHETRTNSIIKHNYVFGARLTGPGTFNYSLQKTDKEVKPSHFFMGAVQDEHSSVFFDRFWFFIPQTFFCSDKCDIVLSLVRGFRHQGRKIVIFTRHLNSVLQIRFKLSKSDFHTTVITGNTSLEDREKRLKFFKQSGTVLIGTVQAIGTGLNLDTASVAILAEIDYNPFKDDQAAGRLVLLL